jgi:4'-phosphopantetheinyl transferase EntD
MLSLMPAVGQFIRDTCSVTSDALAKLSALCAQRLPDPAGIALRFALISDHLDALYPQERAAVVKAVPKRQQEFATGRWLARELMRELDIEPGVIDRGDQRQPLWPAGALGSITHADDIAAASIARADACRSIGLDLETWQRVSPDLHHKLLTQTERNRLAASPVEAAGLIFSAKEAGYKATFPLAGRFIGFKEAEIDLDWSAGQFLIRYVGDHPENRVMEEGLGYFLISGDYVLSWFIIP